MKRFWSGAVVLVSMAVGCCSSDDSSITPDSGLDAGSDGGSDTDSDGGTGSGIKPRLVSPLSTTMIPSLRPTFRWVGGTDDTFTLIISTSNSLEDPEYTWQGQGFSHTPDVDLAPGSHFWRVSVPNNPVDSESSCVWELFIGQREYDVDGDLYSDLLLGSIQGGWFYVFKGGIDFGGEYSTSDADVRIDPSPNSFGNICTSYSDVTGDGKADVVFNQAMGNGGIYFCDIADSSGDISYGACNNLADDVEVQEDNFGGALSTSGDFNRDGFFDLATAAPQATIVDSSEGIVYFYSMVGEPTSSISAREDYLFSFIGNTAWEAVRPLDFVRDMNGDGFSELVVGASMSEAGAWMILGGEELPQINELDVADVQFLKVDSDDKWFGCTDGDDINDDGYGDMLAIHENADGYWGGILYGRDEFPAEIGFSDLAVKILLPGEISIFTTTKITGLGDVNGDGYPDFSITQIGNLGTAWEPDVDPLGAVYVFYGGPDLPEEMVADDADVKIAGNGDPWFAHYATSIGDVNGDGFKDFAVSATGDPLGSDDTFPGRVFIFFGGPTLETKETADQADAIITAEMPDEVLGVCINRGGV